MIDEELEIMMKTLDDSFNEKQTSKEGEHELVVAAAEEIV